MPGPTVVVFIALLSHVVFTITLHVLHAYSTGPFTFHVLPLMIPYCTKTIVSSMYTLDIFPPLAVNTYIISSWMCTTNFGQWPDVTTSM